MEKKNIALILLIIALGGSGVANIILVVTSGVAKAPPDINILRYADTEGGAPAVLDPVDSWDSVSNDVIRHVCDNLWYYDLYDPDFALEMRLATSYEYNTAKDEVNVILREGVYYHDGSYFNATAVKFTFDRILYFINATGTMPNTTTNRICDPASLFFNMQGVPILNKTVINSEYNVTFFLNAPNAIFIPLLSYDAWAILHPDSTPATEFLELGEDILIGTGPFEYDHFIEGEEMSFVRYDMYWGPTTFWDQVIWVYYPDSTTAGNAMLGGEVDAGGLTIPMIDLFIADPDIIFTNLETSTIYRYFGLNNNKINVTMRKAICYAFNYSYYINVIRQGYGIRAHQMLPPGFPYYNATFKAPTLNITIAREAMKSIFPAEIGSLTVDFVSDTNANDLLWAALDLVEWKILQHEGWDLGIDMNAAFTADMDRVGIVVTPDVMDWERYIFVSSYDEDVLEIFHTGWGPDYLDPFNMVAPLLSNLSTANHIQTNDLQVQTWLAEYEQETDTDAKELLLWRIQNRVFNVEYMELAVQYDMVMGVYHRSVGNPCYNIQRNLWFRDSYFIPGIPIAS